MSQIAPYAQQHCLPHCPGSPCLLHIPSHNLHPAEAQSPAIVPSDLKWHPSSADMHLGGGAASQARHGPPHTGGQLLGLRLVPCLLEAGLVGCLLPLLLLLKPGVWGLGSWVPLDQERDLHTDAAVWSRLHHGTCWLGVRGEQ